MYILKLAMQKREAELFLARINANQVQDPPRS